VPNISGELSWKLVWHSRKFVQEHLTCLCRRICCQWKWWWQMVYLGKAYW